MVVEPVPFSDQPKYRLTESQVARYKHLFEKIFFCKTRKAPYDFCSLATFTFSRKNNHPITILRPLRNQSLRLLSNVTKIRRKIRYVSLDEGMSSYYSLFDSLKIIYKSPITTIRKWVEQNLFNMVGGTFIDEMEDYELFKKSTNGLIPNQSVCLALRNLYESRMSEEKSNKPSVILFKDYNVVPDSFSITVFRRVLSTLSSLDVNIIIKKHPSDVESLFDNTLLQEFPHTKIINSVVSVVAENAEIDIPDVMIDNEVESMADEQASRMSQQGIGLDMYLQYTGQSMDDFKAGMKPMALIRVKSNLVIEAVAKELKMEATAEEYEKELEDMAKAYNTDVDNLKQAFGDENPYLKEQIINRKTVEWLADKAVKTEPKDDDAEKTEE